MINSGKMNSILTVRIWWAENVHIVVSNSGLWSMCRGGQKKKKVTKGRYRMETSVKIL